MTALLEIKDLSVNYGPIPALRGVSLSLQAGETLAVIGPNGAGKSTLTLAVAGALRPAAGQVLLEGEPLTGLLPEAVARKGVSLVPEGRHIFEGLTVAENLLLGTTVGENRSDATRAVQAMLEMFPVLGERRDSPATRLSGGEQQQLAIARALLSRPRLLILDEPSLGLAPVIIERVYETLAELKATGVSMLLIEQNPARLERVADRVAILANGELRLEGETAEVLVGSELEQAYLGASGP